MTYHGILPRLAAGLPAGHDVIAAQSSVGNSGATEAATGCLACGCAFAYFTFVVVVIIVLTIPIAWGMAKVYVKAGRDWWAALIPIYNLIVLLEITRRPIWWILFFFLPVANLIVLVIVHTDLARMMGRGVGTGIGLVLLPYIFWPILGFGSAQFESEIQNYMPPPPSA